MSHAPVHNRIDVLHLASGDRWAGAEVQLFTLLSQLRQNDGVQPRAVLLNEGELAQRLRAIDVPVDVLDESRLSSGAIARELIALLRKYRPHILHTHRQKENILGSIANAVSVRARSVRTVHGAEENPPRTLPQKLIRALDRWTGRYLQQHAIAVSNDLAEKLRSHFDPKQLVVIENGIDIVHTRKAVAPAEFRKLAPDNLHIGLIGRLDHVKRIDLFLAMAKELLEQPTDKAWHFHVFGEGALEGSLKQIASTLNINHAVTFHGHRRDIAGCLAALDAIVMCSDHEGLPMTALEAIALGTPVIAHNVGGLSPLLAGEAGGILVDDHSPTGYAEAVRQLLQNNNVELKEKGMTRLREHYSAESNAVKVVDLYRGCLK